MGASLNLIVLFGLASLYMVLAFDTAIPHTQLLMCSKRVEVHGRYGYNNQFHLGSFLNNRSDNTVAFRTKFFVMGARDAHVLFSDKKDPEFDEKVIEVVIGTNNNTRGTIRFNKLHNMKKESNGGIISTQYLTSFDFRAARNGNIELFASGDRPTAPYLTFKDTVALNYTYMSVGTYENVPLVFWLDCPIF